MTQRIVIGYPPIISALEAEFGRGKLRNPTRPILFSYGKEIYNPQGITIPYPLLAHEGVHGRRQLEYGLGRWWEDYVSSPRFRLEEEIPAHIAEARAMFESNPCRKNRLFIISVVGKKLSSPLYGKIISGRGARMIIKKGLSK